MATRCTKCNLELPNGPLLFCPECYTQVPPRPKNEMEDNSSSSITAEKPNTSLDTFLYIGVGVAGFLGTGVIFMFVVGAIPGLTGLVSICGGVIAVIFVRRYKQSQRISLKCQKCGDTSPTNAKHCISCGNTLFPLICPKCQTENVSQAKFCMGCGERR